MRIAIFDDEARQRKGWGERLKDLKRGEVVEMNDDDFRTQVGILEERRKRARTTKVEQLVDIDAESIFDSIEILIVDYDLLQSIDLTGEEITYLLRCYSKCGLVVVLNQFGNEQFDLTLQGHPESFADLNVGDRFLDDPGLWSDEEWREFRPWQWPLLPDLLDKHRKRIDDVRKWMGKPILESLSLDEDSAGILPRKILEFIQCPGVEVGATTFEHFVICSGNGLKRRDSGGRIEELMPHIAAARLHNWLESFVLGGQEVLVDAPHLVTRFPSLLEEDAEVLESWNRTARIPEPIGITRDVLRGFEFRHPDWLSRTAWYWIKTREHEGIREVKDPWSVRDYGHVFCEDTSRFSTIEKAAMFVADLPSKFNRRFVARIEPIKYHPSVRFSL